MGASRQYLIQVSPNGFSGATEGDHRGPAEKAREFFGNVVRSELAPLHNTVSATHQAIVATNPNLEELQKPLPVEATLIRFLDEAAIRKSQKSLATDVPRLVAFFASVKVADVRNVTPQLVNSYLTRTAHERGWHPITYNRHREQLHAFFQWLVKLGQLARNPVGMVSRAPMPASKITALSLPELEQLFALCDADPYVGPLVRVLGLTGLRLSEALWLQWCDIDRDRWRLYVRAKRDGSWQPKTRMNRCVPIQSRLRPTLERLHEERRARELTGGGEVEWVLPSPFGSRWDDANLRKRYRGILEGSAMTWKLLDLRHTFASLLVQRGVTLVQAAALLGNSPAICRRHYAHIATEDLIAEVEF